MKRFLSTVILCLVLYGCSLSAKCGGDQDTSCTRVLFIGNSYTFVNDLPNTFAKLARSGGHKVEVGMSAQGGWALSDHLQSSETVNLLNSTKWNFVVLQEQSQIPSVEPARSQEMYPATRELVQKIKDTGATPIFFITWAHRDGWRENGINNYESMQFQINSGYAGIAQELQVPIAPVGSAWLTAVKEHASVQSIMENMPDNIESKRKNLPDHGSFLKLLLSLQELPGRERCILRGKVIGLCAFIGNHVCFF